MSSEALGPVYRSTADILDAHIPGLNAALEKLRQKILKRLAAKPNIRDRFDRAWRDAETTRGRIQATLTALGRIAKIIRDAGELAGPDIRETYDELTALLDVLRMLLWLEAQAKHYRDLAKAHGY